MRAKLAPDQVVRSARAALIVNDEPVAGRYRGAACHVGTAALGCPVERSSTGFGAYAKSGASLRRTAGAAASTWLVVPSALFPTIWVDRENYAARRRNLVPDIPAGFRGIFSAAASPPVIPR